MRIAIFTVADDNYIKYAVVALKSISRFHDYDLFVVSGGLNKDSLSLLRKHGIEHAYTDKHYFFPDYKKWPRIVFASMFGAEIFYNMGYEYSLGVDPDVLCVKPMDIEQVFNDTIGYSGISNKGPRSRNFKNVEYIKKKYKLTAGELLISNTNAGVIFWNNRAMADFQLGRKCMLAWEDGLFPIADQSLFALVSIQIPFNVLPMKYNYRMGNIADTQYNLKDVFIYHYTGDKPWDGDTLHGDKCVKFSETIL